MAVPASPSTQPPRKKLSISWVAAIVILGVALLVGGVIGAAAGGDQEAQDLADERAERISDLNREISSLEDERDDALRAARLATSTTTTSTTSTTVPPATTTVPAPPPPAPAPAPAPAAGSTYFANCSAARAAGAAPVHVGDPGYGRHLDRDGDGTGCE